MLNRIKLWENNFQYKRLGHEAIISSGCIIIYQDFCFTCLNRENGTESMEHLFLFYFHGHSTQVRLKSLERTQVCLNKQRLLNGKCFNSWTPQMD